MAAAGLIATGAGTPLAAAMAAVAVVAAWAAIRLRLAGHRVTGAMVRHAGAGAHLVE